MTGVFEGWIDADWARIGLPLAAAAATGAAIGFERELKAKAAGLRTHTLVCLSCALLMMAAVQQAEWLYAPIPGSTVVSDPTRMAHGVLTGIGFLGAGAIFRQGSMVHGLTTAASVWMTAALGILYGAGLIPLAVVGTAATLAVLVLFRIFQVVIPDYVEVSVRIACSGGRDLSALEDLLRRRCVRMTPAAWKADRSPSGGQPGSPGRLRLQATLWLRHASDVPRLVEDLRQLEGIESVSVIPVLTADRAPG